jgi:hypothetical protein
VSCFRARVKQLKIEHSADEFIIQKQLPLPFPLKIRSEIMADEQVNNINFDS